MAKEAGLDHGGTIPPEPGQCQAFFSAWIRPGRGERAESGEGPGKALGGQIARGRNAARIGAHRVSQDQK